MVENVDDAFLERQGWDPAGPLFKAVHWKYSNLRPAAPTWAPCAYAPEWESSWGPCPVGIHFILFCIHLFCISWERRRPIYKLNACISIHIFFFCIFKTRVSAFIHLIAL